MFWLSQEALDPGAIFFSFFFLCFYYLIVNFKFWKILQIIFKISLDILLR